jgi:hypothetical protein
MPRAEEEPEPAEAQRLRKAPSLRPRVRLPRATPSGDGEAAESTEE